MRAILLLLLLIACTPEERLVDQSVEGLPDARVSTPDSIEDGGSYSLEARVVSKEIAGKQVRMFGYNAQIPGPTLRVKQGSTVTINFKNGLDLPTTVHWHGLRLDNSYDGVPTMMQPAIKTGDSFEYILRFPDPGIYWYHPHVREDIQQELGLYGAIIVEPTDSNYYGAVVREEVIFLDDIRTVAGQPELFSLHAANYALMGRFGNTMFTNGRTVYDLNASAGERIRLYLINSANTRTFNFSVEDHDFNIIGGDNGLYARPFVADSVILGPSERAIVELSVNEPGRYSLRHTTPESEYVLGSIDVTDNDLDHEEHVATGHALIEQEVARMRSYFDAEPDHVIDLTVNMQSRMMHHGMTAGTDGIEWEDDMVMMNAMSTSDNTKWIIRDHDSGAQNMKLSYVHSVGDIVKMRFFNDPHSPHPMQHVMHLHGQRFLVLNENGKQRDNLVWKDSVLIPTGATVDILVDVTNPGEWMMHCHIAEHLEAGMMSTFEVKP